MNTRERILALSDAELVREAAIKILDWKDGGTAILPLATFGPGRVSRDVSKTYWKPLDSMSDCWMVVGAMRAKEWFFDLHDIVGLDECIVEFHGPDTSEACVDCLHGQEQRAILQAALLACEGSA